MIHEEKNRICEVLSTIPSHVSSRVCKKKKKKKKKMIAKKKIHAAPENCSPTPHAPQKIIVRPSQFILYPSSLTINCNRRTSQHNSFNTTLRLSACFKYIVSSVHCGSYNLHLISWIFGREGGSHMNYIGTIFDSTVGEKNRIQTNLT